MSAVAVVCVYTNSIHVHYLVYVHDRTQYLSETAMLRRVYNIYIYAYFIFYYRDILYRYIDIKYIIDIIDIHYIT